MIFIVNPILRIKALILGFGICRKQRFNSINDSATPNPEPYHRSCLCFGHLV